MQVRYRHHRLQSSLDLFLDACRLWGKTFENDDLLWQIRKMEEELTRTEMSHCPESLINKVEEATEHLINNMDNFLKSIGNTGFSHPEVLH